MSFRLASILAFLVACGGWWLPATAQSGPDIGELNDKAIELSEKGAFQEAIAIWMNILEDEGDRSQYAPILHMNVGRNYQKMEMLPEAWWHLNRGLVLSGGTLENAANWRDEVAAQLKKDHLQVTVDVKEPGCLVVMRYGKKLRTYPAPLVWWLRPGEHQLTVSGPDGRMLQRPITVAAGRTDFVLSSMDGSTAIPINPDPPITKVGSGSSRGLSAVEWVLLGGAATLAIAGGITYGVAYNNLEDLRTEFKSDYPAGSYDASDQKTMEDDWDDRLSSNVNSWEYASYALWGVSAAAAVAGGVLIAYNRTGSRKDKAVSITIAPITGPAPGAAVGFTF